jgi:hypothetical protein
MPMRSIIKGEAHPLPSKKTTYMDVPASGARHRRASRIENPTNSPDAVLECGTANPLDVYSATRRSVAKQIVTLTNGLTRLAIMDRNLRTLRSVVLSALNPFVSRSFAWQLSGFVYRGSSQW